MHRGVTGTLVFSCNDFFWSMCCPLAGATDGKIVKSASFTCTHIMQSIYKAKERGLFKSMEIKEYFFTFLNILLNVNLKQTFKFACKSKLINMFLGFVFCFGTFAKTLVFKKGGSVQLQILLHSAIKCISDLLKLLIHNAFSFAMNHVITWKSFT